MKRWSTSLLCAIALVQMCIAAFLAVYSFGISTAEGRDKDDFSKCEQEWKKTEEPKIDYMFQPSRISRKAYKIAESAEQFSTTVFVASIVLFVSGFIQFLGIQKPSKPPIIAAGEVPKSS